MLSGIKERRLDRTIAGGKLTLYMKLMPVIEFPESFFTKGENYVLVSEASDMQNRHLQPLFADGRKDVGFNVRLDTGQLVTFTFSDVIRIEGEVAAWEYTAPHGAKALVIND
jgi:hypothetical protein